MNERKEKEKGRTRKRKKELGDVGLCNKFTFYDVQMT